eukprot:451911-Pleurochrysis_carterae.AAC.1
MEREPFLPVAARIRASAESSNAWRPGRIRHAHLLASSGVAGHGHVAWPPSHSCTASGRERERTGPQVRASVHRFRRKGDEVCWRADLGHL